MTTPPLADKFAMVPGCLVGAKGLRSVTVVDGVQLTPLMASVLLEHANGERPLKISDDNTLRGLQARRLVRFNRAVRPSRTIVTPRGREVMSSLLAQMADLLLVRAQGGRCTYFDATAAIAQNAASSCPVSRCNRPSEARWMDRSFLQDQLTAAERRVADCTAHVERQRALIEELRRDGHDPTDALSLLKQFEEILQLHARHQNRLRQELAEDG